MAIIKETIPVHKHFLIIDSPVPFTLVANNGTDEVYRMAGAWRIDLWKILTKDYFKQYPVFTLDLVYDDTNLGGKTIEVRQSDIDLGEGIAGVNGQDVHITNFNDLPENYKVTNELDSSDNRIPLEVNIANIDDLKKKYVVKQGLTNIKNYIQEKGIYFTVGYNVLQYCVDLQFVEEINCYDNSGISFNMFNKHNCFCDYYNGNIHKYGFLSRLFINDFDSFMLSPYYFNYTDNAIVNNNLTGYSSLQIVFCE